jgi:DNA-binding transcriptional LysR family regulator
MRNLDLASLRSFVAIIDAGGVTRAAGFLNLTQSAVSMQIKRLEEVLDVSLLDRSTRKLAPTAAGEQLLGYARKMLALNDEVFNRLTQPEAEGEIILGVPHDIVYPTIPPVLRAFNAEYPKMRITLVSSFTKTLKQQFAMGEVDLILTTESTLDPQGETVAELPLVWIGAVGGAAWRARPLRLAFEQRCYFRAGVQAALDAQGIAWEMAVDGSSTRAVEASVSADLAVHTVLAGSEPQAVERISHGGVLPDLGAVKVNLYVADPVHSPAITVLAGMIRQAYRLRAGRDTAPALPKVGAKKAALKQKVMA